MRFSFWNNVIRTHQVAGSIVSFAKWPEQHETVFGQQHGDLVQMVNSREKMGMLSFA